MWQAYLKLPESNFVTLVALRYPGFNDILALKACLSLGFSYEEDSLKHYCTCISAKYMQPKITTNSGIW